jgi:hypothetical protein
MPFNYFIKDNQLLFLFELVEKAIHVEENNYIIFFFNNICSNKYS